jgi:hypothetical protein
MLACVAGLLCEEPTPKIEYVIIAYTKAEAKAQNYTRVTQHAIDLDVKPLVIA